MTYRWVYRGGWAWLVQEPFDDLGAALAVAGRSGGWTVYSLDGRPSRTGQADSTEAAQAAVEAEIWAQAAEGLAGR